ncbi:MAG: vanomycin resistance protein VanB [Clostridiaceae bacterium]|nr:vanomycin resistance protein VanB [Clostridiaceae bacterium]
MNNQINKYEQQRNRRQVNPRIIKYGLMYFLIIFIISSAYIGWSAYSLLNHSKIYSGVYIGDLHVGGKTKDSVIENFPKIYQQELDERVIRISSKGKSIEFTCKEIDATYDIENAVSQAFDVGRYGNIFSRIATISNAKKNKVIIPLKIKVDLDKVESKIKELAEQVDVPVKEYQTMIEGDRLVVINGVSGERINISEAVSIVLNAVNSKNINNVELPLETVEPEKVDVDKLYEQIYKEPEDARYEIKNYRIQVIPHKAGISFDKAEAEEIIKNHQSEGEKYYIPLSFTQPTVLQEYIEKNLFKDKFSSFTTSFSVSYAERIHNINLAGNAINGTVIGPGEVFSYNDVVGDRTYETGYKNAKIYVGGQIVDGVGGGICQVSTTLYNAALFADLEIVNRYNHSMTVSYVPPGQDAAVAYDVLDLKFRNNTEWPIRIDCIIRGGNITFEIWGTKNGVNKTIEIENKIIKTVPFTTKYVDDPGLEEGKTVVQQNGANGYVVDTYKITKIDGQVVSRKKISTSSYMPIEHIVKRGTKKVEAPGDVKSENVTKPDTQPEQQNTAPQEVQGDEDSADIPSNAE